MDKKNECQICGKPINLEEFDETREIPQLMARKQVCFQCAFWFNRLDYDKELEKEGKIAVITPAREYNFETNTRYIAQSFNYFIDE